jgi:hypothetical protein
LAEQRSELQQPQRRLLRRRALRLPELQWTADRVLDHGGCSVSPWLDFALGRRTGGLTTTAAGGGATTTAGRGGNSACRSLGDHRTNWAGERQWRAEAGAQRWAARSAAEERSLRGSGRAGGRRSAATMGAGGAGRAVGGCTTGGAPAHGSAGPLLPSSCFLARMAFSTSPGLEICERSILGVMP